MSAPPTTPPRPAPQPVDALGPAPSTAPAAELAREPARDTLAPSSFGVLAGSKAPAPRPPPQRSARGPLPTLGDLQGATATATLRPPGAVPPPPRALPMPVQPPDTSSLDTTLDMSESASTEATQAALVASTRVAEPVPPPGLFIADAPLEPRPQPSALATEERALLTRLRLVVLLLGGLLLMLAGALVVTLSRGTEASAARGARATASLPTATPGCRLALPPSRISPRIERSVPISARPLEDGNIALGIAESKGSAAGWIYDPVKGEAIRELSPASGGGNISYVTPEEPLLVERASPDFAFARALSPGLAVGVGPAGLLRRGNDGATGVVWALPAGVKVTAPRVVSIGEGHAVTFRQGGPEGELLLGWLRKDGTAASELSPVVGAPKSVGTPNIAALGEEVVALAAARADKTEPYRIYAARAKPGEKPRPAQVLDLPAEGGGAIAPALTALGAGRHLVQWTDGSVGQYRVQVRVLDGELAPLSDPLLVSAKGANAGQGTVVLTRAAAVSLFIQTTAGHDELWGASLSCR